MSAHPLVVAARAIGVRDARVLDAVAAVPRASYVPRARVAEADVDRPIPIGAGQVTTQPSLVAAMVEALALHGDERVLEVGTGPGYEAAILGRLAREVWTVERLPEFAARPPPTSAPRASTTCTSASCRRHWPLSSRRAAGSFSRSDQAALTT